MDTINSAELNGEPIDLAQPLKLVLSVGGDDIVSIRIDLLSVARACTALVENDPSGHVELLHGMIRARVVGRQG